MSWYSCDRKGTHAHPLDETKVPKDAKETAQFTAAPKQTDKKGKTAYPFLENTDEREVTIFTILMVTKPFATAKMQRWCFVIQQYTSIFSHFPMDDGVELRFGGADDAVVIDDPMAMTAVRR
jgi:hypothetical protein